MNPLAVKVGLSLGGKILGGILDSYLGDTGWQKVEKMLHQQFGEPVLWRNSPIVTEIETFLIYWLDTLYPVSYTSQQVDWSSATGYKEIKSTRTRNPNDIDLLAVIETVKPPIFIFADHGGQPYRYIFIRKRFGTISGFYCIEPKDIEWCLKYTLAEPPISLLERVRLLWDKRYIPYRPYPYSHATLAEIKEGKLQPLKDVSESGVDATMKARFAMWSTSASLGAHKR